MQRAEEGRRNGGVGRREKNVGKHRVPKACLGKGKDEPGGMGTARGPWEEERGRGMQRDGEEREVPGGRGCGGDSLRGAA